MGHTCKKLNLRIARYRPLVDTYYHLLRHFPEEQWSELSHRKQVCLIYMKWLIFPRDKKLRARLVDKVQEWRLKEPNRLGGKRSLLERAVRKKLFKIRKKEKLVEKNYDNICKSVRLQKENKTGSFTEEARAFRKSPANGHKANATRNGKTHAADWIVFAPDGTRYEVHNLRAFCRDTDFGLDQSHLSKTSLHPGGTHKGWRAIKKNSFFDLSNFTD